MWSSNGSHLATVKAELLPINEHHGREYSAYFVFCPIKGLASVPHSVSIKKDLQKPSSNHLLVNKLEKINDQANKMSMAMCVAPIHLNYNKTMMLIEFLEYYKLLGVSHVTLYNHSISEETSCVLKNYEQNGFATILPWDFSQMNMVSEKDVRIEASPAALNDCLYRNTYRFTHLVTVDFDEFIVPQHHYTLHDLIRSIDPSSATSSTGSYLIQNTFFYQQWPDDEHLKETARDLFEEQLVTLSKTRRLRRLFAHRDRSKLILRPEFTEEVGIHFVWKHADRYQSMNVHASDAIVNHYRCDCEDGTAVCVNRPSKTDRTIYRYRRALTNNVRAKWNELSNKCRLPHL